MKLNNLAIQGKRAGLFAVWVLMLASCQSDEERLAQLDAEIARLESRIDSTYIHNEITDSVLRDAALQKLGDGIERDRQHIDSLRARNWALTDSINQRKVARASGKYPLGAFLSKQDLKIIQNQLRNFHSEWNTKYANNIISGRGTLLDLYNTCFDLDYSAFEPPFHIVGESGSVRFNDERLNRFCVQFEHERDSLENQEVFSRLRRRANQLEFAENERQIKDFDRRCEISDSMYLEIANHFRPQITKRCDSLANRRDSLKILRADLRQKINARHR